MMMTTTRCKKHFSDVSSTVGVCASCLRERLFSVIASQAQAQALTRSRDHDLAFPNDSVAARPPDPPPQFVFPRSVSPYVARRRGNDDHFYHTPQVQKVGPVTGDTLSMPDSRRGSGRNGRWSRKLSFLQHLLVFRSRPDRVDLGMDHKQVSSGFDHNSPESSPSLFSHLKGRWKNRPPRREKNTSYTDDESSLGQSGWTVRPTPDRGFPPEYSDGECCKGCSSERATPASVMGRRNGRSYPTEVGMRFCLSPLVRATPAGRRRPSSEVGYSIDVRVPATAKSGRIWGNNNRDRRRSC